MCLTNACIIIIIITSIIIVATVVIILLFYGEFLILFEVSATHARITSHKLKQVAGPKQSANLSGCINSLKNEHFFARLSFIDIF